METQLFILFNKFSLLILLTTTTTTTITTSAADSLSSSAPPTTNPFHFIRSSCNATLYPDVCYTSLSRYANAVQQDLGHLALFAIGVSLGRARRTSTYFSNMTRQADYGPDSRAASALHDCSSTFGDAVDQMRDSLSQMRQLGVGGAPAETRFQLSNVQTWMSSALTNEDTCSDGFQDVADCPLKTDVCSRVADVKQLTSNALALVNSYAASLGS